jgi:IS30 family transposase
MNKHLTLDDRLEIQMGLKSGENFTTIAQRIDSNRTTVSREVKARRIPVHNSKGNNCIHRNECQFPEACSHYTPGRYRYGCHKGKQDCGSACGDCINGCDHFQEDFCTRYEKPPYVCASCPERRTCRLQKMEYDAKLAQEAYETLRSESRKGISLSEEELAYLDSVVSPEIKRGQAVSVVWNTHKGEMPVSDRTLYTYINSGLLDADNFDLRRKLRMPSRKKSGPVLRVDKQCHIGRSYEDYESYMARHPDAVISQMDSVIGRKGGKVLLTILFKNCDLQLMYLRGRNTAASVTAIFQTLRSRLGDQRFSTLFQVILTDRGSEFTDPVKIECDMETGEIQCRVFYCDPMNSNQKSNCERNHEFIRYVLPKGTSMDRFTQTDITKLMNHINSYPRKKWNGQAPLDLFIQIYGKETATLLGLEKIPSDSINLTPALLN